LIDMMSQSANTAAIRITQLKAALAAMTGSPDGRSAAGSTVGSLEEEIEFLEKQIESDLELAQHADESIAQPIAPNI
jgi:hypothetical protein